MLVSVFLHQVPYSGLAEVQYRLKLTKDLEQFLPEKTSSKYKLKSLFWEKDEVHRLLPKSRGVRQKYLLWDIWRLEHVLLKLHSFRCRSRDSKIRYNRSFNLSWCQKIVIILWCHQFWSVFLCRAWLATRAEFIFDCRFFKGLKKFFVSVLVLKHYSNRQIWIRW